MGTVKYVAIEAGALALFLYLSHKYWHHKRAGLIIPVIWTAALGVSGANIYYYLDETK